MSQTRPLNHRAAASFLIDLLIDALEKKILVVTFVKENGEVRKMVCTANCNLMPSKPKYTSMTHAVTAARVWDFEADGFRSFRWDSIVSIEGL